jgi:hypothetical protein
MDKKKSENTLIPIFQKMLLSDGDSFELSMKEIEKLKEFEEENINKLLPFNNNRIFCDLCNHDYRIDNYKKHLRSKKHLKKNL